MGDWFINLDPSNRKYAENQQGMEKRYASKESTVLDARGKQIKQGLPSHTELDHVKEVKNK